MLPPVKYALLILGITRPSTVVMTPLATVTPTRNRMVRARPHQLSRAPPHVTMASALNTTVIGLSSTKPYVIGCHTEPRTTLDGESSSQ